MDNLKINKDQMKKVQKEIPIKDEQQFKKDDGEIMEIIESKYLLQFVKIFEHLKDDDRYNLCHEFVHVEFNDNDKIIDEGDEGKFFYIILEGAAIVYKKPSDDQLAVEFAKLGPYDHFGGLALFFNRPYAGTVKAKGPLKCLKMDHDKFKKELEPMLRVLERSAGQYKSFINFPV